VTLWAGRVDTPLSSAVWEFLRAQDDDLLEYDVAATVEHAHRLHAAGLLSADEVREVEERLEEITVDDIAATDVVTISPSASVLQALETIVRESVEHVPVVEGGCLVGICTRTDVLRARARKLNEERPPPSLGRRRS